MIYVSSFPFHRNKEVWHTCMFHLSRQQGFGHNTQPDVGTETEVEGQVRYGGAPQIRVLRQVNQGSHLFRNHCLNLSGKQGPFLFVSVACLCLCP